jgi:flavodoxin
MKTLVVYYSRTGNTRKVAAAIAAAAGADIEEIVEEKDRRGVRGYLAAGRDAVRKQQTPICAAARDPAAYELVIVGTPVWAFTVAPPVRTYLAAHAAALRRAAFFCTLGGSGADRTFRAMREVCGRAPAATLALTEKDVAAGRFESICAFCDRAAGAAGDVTGGRAGQ